MLKRPWHLPEIQFTGIRFSAVSVLPFRNMSITGDQILTPRAIRKRFEGHAIIRLSIMRAVCLISC
jgi:hypothetical protein